MREVLEYVFCPTGSSGSWQETNGTCKKMTEDTIIRNIYRGAVSAKEPLKDGETRVAQCRASPARSLEG